MPFLANLRASREEKRAWVLGPALLICLVAALALLGAYVAWRADAAPVFCDFDLRYNEMLCSHQGVDPYDVWERKTTVGGMFQGFWRPDMPRTGGDETRPGVMYVHSYPAWHTTYFWWYAWLPRSACHFLMLLLSAASYAAAFAYLYRNCLPEALPRAGRAMVVSLAFLACAPSAGFQIRMINYGAMLLLLFLLAVECLRRGHDVACGACLAVMMVKPQVAIPFFWPLLIARRYRAVLAAVAICSLATLWPSFVYGRSPVELLLELTKFGAPYVALYKGPLFRLSRLVFGHDLAMFGQMAAGFAACGALSWLVRGSKSWLVRFLPAMAVFPLWTYSWSHDLVMHLCCYSAIASLAVFCIRHESLRRHGLALGALFAAAVLSALVQTAYEALYCHGLLEYRWRLVPKSFNFAVAMGVVAAVPVVSRIVPALNAEKSTVP